MRKDARIGGERRRYMPIVKRGKTQEKLKKNVGHSPESKERLRYYTGHVGIQWYCKISKDTKSAKIIKSLRNTYYEMIKKHFRKCLGSL